MKKILLLFMAAFLAFSVQAQVLPRPSPLAKTSQVVGVTEVSVEYYRPGVKERTVFGDLVPYGELWRFGANACTKFTTADDISFGENRLSSGTYAVFAIPNEDGNWEIIFNTDTEQGGTADYDQSKDALRLNAAAKTSEFSETFTLGFDNITHTSAHFVIEWENVKLAIPFEVDTDVFALRNINDAIEKGEDLDKVHANAASYHLSTTEAYALALEHVEKSLEIKESFGALFTKARILAKTDDTEKAIELAEKALTMAQEAGSKGYANFISGTLEEWKK